MEGKEEYRERTGGEKGAWRKGGEGRVEEREADAREEPVTGMGKEERQGGLLLHSLPPFALPLSLLSAVALRTVGVQITETLVHLLQLKMPERCTSSVS